MKKIISLLIMLMFVFSIIGAVYADSEGAVSGNGASSNSGNNEEVEIEIENEVEEDEDDDTGTKGKIRERIQAQNEAIGEIRRERLEIAAEIKDKRLEILREGDKLTEEDIAKLQALSRARINALKDLNAAQLRASLARIKLVRINNAELITKQRVIAKEKLVELKDVIKNRVDAYKNAKEKYRERKGQLKDMSEELKECKKTDFESEECQALQKEGFEHAQQMLLNSAERAKNAVEERISRIQASEDVDEEDATEWIADLEEISAQLDEIIEKINNAETSEELREIARELNALLKRIHYRAQIVAYRFAYSGVWGILKRADFLEKKLERKIAKLEDDGIDTSSVEEMLDEFSGLIESAKENARLANEKFKDAHELRVNQGDAEEIKALIDEGKEYLQAAKDDIRDAYDVMKDIIQELRELTGSNSVDLSEEEAELEEEAYEVIEEAEDAS